jgi:hypothetical protein
MMTLKVYRIVVKQQPLGEQPFMILSMAAMLGVETPRTLKINGLIHGVEMLILIDSSSSHSFISEQVAVVLNEITTVSSPTHVQVANGHTLQSLSKMLNGSYKATSFTQI